jgi:hypothetical protein
MGHVLTRLVKILDGRVRHTKKHGQTGPSHGQMRSGTTSNSNTTAALFLHAQCSSRRSPSRLTYILKQLASAKQRSTAGSNSVRSAAKATEIHQQSSTHPDTSFSQHQRAANLPGCHQKTWWTPDSSADNIAAGQAGQGGFTHQ